MQEQTTYRDDIQKAYDDIVTIINELTGEMQTKFSDAFDQISENFKDVFQQLFGGGKGELRLNMQDTEDVLEAGIDIYAQPPGKKLQNISLLSGGEQALTAISILFAILKLKPMPFCVLDEIEAALDDANVNLFAEFLKNSAIIRSLSSSRTENRPCATQTRFSASRWKKRALQRLFQSSLKRRQNTQNNRRQGNGVAQDCAMPRALLDYFAANRASPLCSQNERD